MLLLLGTHQLCMLNNLERKRIIKLEDNHPRCVCFIAILCVHIVVKHKVPEFVELKIKNGWKRLRGNDVSII